VDAFPDDSAPSYRLRDRDSIYGHAFRERVKGMGISEARTAPRSHYHRARTHLSLAKEKRGEPSGTRTRDPLIKSGGPVPALHTFHALAGNGVMFLCIRPRSLATQQHSRDRRVREITAIPGPGQRKIAQAGAPYETTLVSPAI